MRDQPQIDYQHLPGDVCEGSIDTVADRTEPACGQKLGNGQYEQAEYRSGQTEKESRRQKISEQQTACHYAQQRYPCRHTPAITRQHDQRDDVGQAGLYAGQRRGDGALQYRQPERNCRHACDVVIFVGGV